MKPLLLTLNLLAVPDAAQTHYCLDAHACHEAWIPSQNPWAIDASVAASAAAQSWILWTLDTHGHPKMARVIGWSLVAGRGAVLAHNLQLAHQAGR
jgi:hypothetical protein